MITITTATGKTFESDYSVTIPKPPCAFIRIIGQDYETVKDVFSNEEELPLEEYPQFLKVADLLDESNGIKLILKP